MNSSLRYKKKYFFMILIIAVSISLSGLLLCSSVFASAGNQSQQESVSQEQTNKESGTKPEDSAASVGNTKVSIDKVDKDASLLKYPSFKWGILKNGKIIYRYRDKVPVLLPDAADYNKVQGVTCFRGNNYRNSASYGTADIKRQKLKKMWFVKTGYIDEWTGTGWNGQPSIIRWDDGLKAKMNMYESKKSERYLKEVIYAALDGKIYFLDLKDGKPTRLAIDVGYPHKGSVSVDPRGYPLLYAGQGIPVKGGKPVPIGYRIFSLIDQKLLYFINGMDRDALRHWGAFDSGGLVDVRTDTLYECGENGILYKVKLNTGFDLHNGKISIEPDILKYRYCSPFGTKIGMENSPAIYKNFIYFADNSGLYQCVDLNTMKPVWIRNVTDDTDSSTAIDVSTEKKVYLYTACEVDRQGVNGYSFIRKLDALTGRLIWEKSVKCYFDSHTNGGALASPVIGKNDIKDLVIYNIAKVGPFGKESLLVALDKTSGREVWKKVLKHYCWSSPVDIYTKSGKSYIIQCDSGGYMRLLEGKTGKELDCIPLGANIESSPAVYDNMIVVGTRGQKIWCIKVE